MVYKFIRKMLRNKFRTFHPIRVLSNSDSRLLKNSKFQSVSCRSNLVFPFSWAISGYVPMTSGPHLSGRLGFPPAPNKTEPVGPTCLVRSAHPVHGSLSPHPHLVPPVTDLRSTDQVHPPRALLLSRSDAPTGRPPPARAAPSPAEGRAPAPRTWTQSRP